jgi:hypothetical protein
MVEGAWNTIFICWHVAWQILEIIGSQIEATRIFNFVDIYTNLQQSWLCIDNLEMLINIYKK